MKHERKPVYIINSNVIKAEKRQKPLIKVCECACNLAILIAFPH